MPKKAKSAEQKRAIKLAINSRLAKQRASKTCPQCERDKPSGWPFCGTCRDILPQRIRSGFSGLIGFGYNQAHQEALTFLARFTDTHLEDEPAEDTGTDREHRGPGASTSGHLFPEA